MTLTTFTIIYGVPIRDIHLFFNNESRGFIDNTSDCKINGITFNTKRMPHDQKEEIESQEKVRFFDYLVDSKLIERFSSESIGTQKLIELLWTETEQEADKISDEQRRMWVSDDDEFERMRTMLPAFSYPIKTNEFVNKYLSEYADVIQDKFPLIYHKSTGDDDDGGDDDEDEKEDGKTIEDIDWDYHVIGIQVCSLSIYCAGDFNLDLDELLRIREIYEARLNDLMEYSGSLPRFFDQTPKIYFVQNDCYCCS